MSDLSEAAVQIASKATGLRPDQVKAALQEYRGALEAVEVEPEWTATMHISGPNVSLHQYADPTGKTAVTLQIEGKRRSYALGRQTFATFGEARQIEIERTTRTKPRDICPSPSPT